MENKSNIIKRAVLGCALVCAAGSVIAQNTESGYFNDEYLFRYQMNPSIANERSFVSMPAIGNIMVGLSGNLHLNNVLYNINGKTTTFLNPQVDAAQFLDGIKNNSRLQADTRINLLAVGFKAFHGYNTITLSTRETVGFKLPKSVFSLLKEGISNDTYDLAGMSLYGQGIIDLSFSHSHRINNRLRVGGAVKLLIGGANISTDITTAKLQLGQDSWNIMADAKLNASMKGLRYETEYNSDTNRRYVNNVKIDDSDLGVAGVGVALDLGAEYRLNEDWNFGLALNDLGFISWNNNMVASTNGLQQVQTSKYQFNVDGDSPNSFKKEWEKIRNDLSLIYQLNDLGDQGSRTTMMGATMYAAADYTLPVYRKLVFGLLNTTRFQGEYTWTRFRLSANVAPGKAFSAGINYSIGTFGSSFGWIVNVHPKGFNLFIAADHTPGKLAKQGVPLHSNTQFNFGINFPF